MQVSTLSITSVARLILQRGALVPAVLAVFLFVTFLSDPTDAQRRRRQAQERVTDSTTVRVIEVPTNVSQGGDAVRGLSKDSFEVTEDRKKQDITGFEVVDLSAETDGVTANVPAAARRYMLLFFDLSTGDPAAIVRARDAARDAVNASLHPTDLAGVATYSRQKGPQLLLPFTTDRAQLRQVMEGLGIVQGSRIQSDPLGLVPTAIDAELAAAEDTEGSGGGLGVDAGSELAAQLQATANLRKRSTRDEATSRVGELMDGLQAMAGMMASVEGRKHVLLLSEGFDGELLFGTEDMATIQQQSQTSQDGQIWNVDNEARFGRQRGAACGGSGDPGVSSCELLDPSDRHRHHEG